ncbi:MAG: hypothetical protein Q4B48_08625 [Syntrophomonadaceae bacterium]|nr:hypothetical protein [Syntrophomonadaceae bacterium]
MRRAFIVTLLLLIAALVGVGGAALQVNSARDQVVLAAHTVQGDPAAAHGLTVRCHATYDDRLFWDTSYSAGPEAVTTTEYTFSSTRREQPVAPLREGVFLERMSFKWLELDRGFDPATSTPLTGLPAAFQALYDAAAPGEEKTAVVNLRDYYDYYPLTVTLNLPGTPFNQAEDDPAHFPPHQVPEEYAAVTAAFQEFFKFPVLADEQIELSVQRDADGYAVGYGSSATSDAFHLWSVHSAVTADACYFTFNNRTQNGGIIDTSHIPGGYGIYCLPFSAMDSIAAVRAEELYMAYPLDPAVEFLHLGLAPRSDRLLLHTREDGKYMMTVIDIATMSARQRLEIGEGSENEFDWFVFEGDGFLTVGVNYRWLAVIAATPDGDYEVRFTAEVAGEQASWHQSLDWAVMDYDGRRLAVADFLWNTDMTGHITHQGCGFYLAVYDETGLAYWGEYPSSLSRGAQNQRYACRPVNYEPLAVSWE